MASKKKSDSCCSNCFRVAWSLIQCLRISWTRVAAWLDIIRLGTSSYQALASRQRMWSASRERFFLSRLRGLGNSSSSTASEYPRGSKKSLKMLRESSSAMTASANAHRKAEAATESEVTLGILFNSGGILSGGMKAWIQRTVSIRKLVGHLAVVKRTIAPVIFAAKYLCTSSQELAERPLNLRVLKQIVLVGPYISMDSPILEDSQAVFEVLHFVPVGAIDWEDAYIILQGLQCLPTSFKLFLQN